MPRLLTLLLLFSVLLRTSAGAYSPATLTSLPDAAVVGETHWGYDPMGNRLWEQAGSSGARREWTRNRLHQLVAQTTYTASARPWVKGTVSEPATVALGGSPVAVKADLSFEGQAPAVQTGVTATDRSGNVTAENWQLAASGSGGASQSLTYDNGGNLLTDGTSTFEWDLRNRLTAIVTGTHRSEFGYDGQSHRVRVIEKDNGAVTTDRRYVWAGDSICEERDTATGTVRRRFHAEGHVDVAGGGIRYLYTRDHLGSVREVLQLSGTTGDPAGGTLVARYDYTPWGARTVAYGGSAAENLVLHGFTGHVRHTQSGVWLAAYRAYSPGLGRWLSRDPLNGLDGLNPYAYVSNAPTVAWDADGRFANWLVGGIIGGVIGGTVEWGNNGDFWGKGMLHGAIAGAVTGGTFGIGLAAVGGSSAGMGATVLMSAYTGMMGEMSAQCVEQLMGKPCGYDWNAIGWAGAFSGLGTAAAKGVQALFARFAAPAAKTPLPKTTPNVKPGSYHDKPPGWNENWEWHSSTRAKTGSDGWRWRDSRGGEWRRHVPDKHHPEAHWDYNPNTQWNSPWSNIDDTGNFLLFTSP